VERSPVVFARLVDGAPADRLHRGRDRFDRFAGRVGVDAAPVQSWTRGRCSPPSARRHIAARPTAAAALRRPPPRAKRLGRYPMTGGVFMPDVRRRRHRTGLARPTVAAGRPACSRWPAAPLSATG